ncbi:unnamed protein product [Discosporangium mesarthrocarpum]
MGKKIPNQVKENGGKKRYKTAPEETRVIPERVMVCKGCELIFARSEVKRCGWCTSAWYCTSECQIEDWNACHKIECSRKMKARGEGNQSDKEDTGPGHLYC